MTHYNDKVHGPVPTPDEHWRKLNNVAQQELKIKRLDPMAIIPAYQTENAACFDLHALEGATVPAHGGTAQFRTGIAVELPPGHTMLIYSRSGHGFKNGLRLVNAVGVLDADFRGEVAVKIINDSPIEFSFTAGARVAQAMIVPIPRIKFVEVDELSATGRGGGGFGSTGE